MIKVRDIIIFLAGLAAGGVLTGYAAWRNDPQWISPGGEVTVEAAPLPYLKYGIEELARRETAPGTIERGRMLSENDGFVSYVFYYQSEGKKISGQMNLPITPESRKFPVVVMARGYVDKEIYTTGVGTKNAAAYYASHGYITLAPDFAGFGESDAEDEDAIGARLSKPVQILDLLASLVSIPAADVSRVYLWGHSNGGQIMLSVAEILGHSAPQKYVPRCLTLWAPVTAPFPYSILYYTDEVDDKGKWLRSQISEFEKSYDVYAYSIDRYWDWITIPVQLHQGSADEEVPQRWSDEFAAYLEKHEKDMTYHVYPGADHNLRGAWNTVVERDLVFFDTFK